MEIKEESLVSWPEARKVLEAKEKEKELGYEQKNALEHLRKFSKLTDKKVKEMKAELEKVGRLKERQIVLIINLMPQNAEDLRILLANEVVTLSEDDKKKILSIVKKHT